MMLTTSDAQAAGWEFVVDGNEGRATHPNHPAEFHVVSDIPLFALTVSIAEATEQGFVAGYGGDEHPTSDLVKEVSGETYTEPVVPQDEAPVEVRLAAALEEAAKDPHLTAQDIAKALAKVLRS